MLDIYTNKNSLNTSFVSEIGIYRCQPHVAKIINQKAHPSYKPSEENLAKTELQANNTFFSFSRTFPYFSAYVFFNTVFFFTKIEMLDTMKKSSPNKLIRH